MGVKDVRVVVVLGSMKPLGSNTRKIQDAKSQIKDWHRVHRGFNVVAYGPIKSFR